MDEFQVIAEEIGKTQEETEREIVIAIVAPVGSPVDATVNALKESFQGHRYSVSEVRISRLLETAGSTLDSLADARSDLNSSRLARLMTLGDSLRSEVKDDAACAYLAVAAIRRERRIATGDPAVHRPRHVTVVRSLKTTGEIRSLRAIYGERLVVVGVSVPTDGRRRELEKQLRGDFDNVSLAGEVATLIARDESDETNHFGQRMRAAFQLADAFVAVSDTGDGSQAKRLVELMLGTPWSTPSRDEQGMFHAWAAKFRSSAAGRQVGAAIVDDLGEVVVLGCNDVPKPGGGQFWEGDASDGRDFQHGFDANDRGKFETAKELLLSLARDGWLSDEFTSLAEDARAELALTDGGPLSKGRVNNLIEFGRIVHAEMAALMTAAREGRSVRGGTLYTTTYPCHECARLIIAAGIERVVYIDPYSKSLAPEIYAASFNDSGNPHTVRVNQLVGVSPRFFSRVFEMSNRGRDIKGEYTGSGGILVTQNEEFSDSIPAQEEACLLFLEKIAPWLTIQLDTSA